MAGVDGPPGAEPDPRITDLIGYWRRLAPGLGMLPGRQHFDPLQVHRYLPNIWLVDVVPGPPPRYRLRLAGEAVVQAGILVRPGDFIDEERHTNDVNEARRQLDAVLASRAPDWRRGRPTVRHSKYVDLLERVILPLAADGQTVDMLLCMTVFYWTDGRARA